MTFSKALEHIKAGKQLSRKGWLTSGAMIYLVHRARAMSFIELYRRQGGIMYAANCEDLLADDWEIRE